MRAFLFSAALVTALASGQVAADDVEITFGGGRVTVIATDVPVQAILGEWARVGDTTFVDAEGLTGPPVHLQLIDVPETEALRVLLRDAAGYVAARRAAAADTSSRFDRVRVMPTSRIAPTASARTFDAGTSGLSPAQQEPTVTGLFPNPSANLAFDELEELRELLPQPFDDIDDVDEMDRPSNLPGGAPATAPRPGMVVSPAEAPAPFIRRPVRPQPSDDNRR